ncbi:anthranilate synthase component I family protein [Halostagnicola sp. A-GB9-2]|uniref:anthranilate synthase component I family protein n=1 Tax=Halostagnicola sp. A-GB9-2 TaxID=3048066 RepID=UPI0024BF84FB|nr:anthranilate synthase component I family protein [Halostagnicola sp. A-GB9-2]MDJ1430926.1 anthranilate synthase component I family protein [Halostagnicola sp. A-GB9-2]
MTAPRVVTSLESVRETVRSELQRAGRGETSERVETTGVRVPIEVRVSVDDSFLAYRRARKGAGGAFLETTGGQPGWGYFGVDPVDRLTVSRAVATRDGDDDQSSSPTLAALEGLLEGDQLVRGDCTVPYPCGAIGWLSYDIVRELEELPESAVDDRDLPQLEVEFYDRLAAWEEPTDGEVTLRVTACPRIDPDGDIEAGGKAVADDAIESAYERGRNRALELTRDAIEGDIDSPDPPVSTPEATFESDCGRESFAERVRQVKEYVHDGDTFQANISQRLTAPAAVHPVAAYDALRRVNPAPYSCLLEFRAADLVSASPELLLEREDSFVRTEPIAGTRPRGETAVEDRALEADILGDEKERAEHAMLVDLERNDLGKVCAYGSVDVEEYRRVDRYSEVMHLVSDITGRLREGESLADAIAAVFPGGTITGAPKPRTMAIIDELEATRRGPYTGSVGIFGFDGRATLNIVIRTLVRHEDEYHLRVGAGIVEDSVPDREYDETLDKARALLTAVDEALGERAEMGLESGGDGEELDRDDGVFESVGDAEELESDIGEPEGDQDE